MRSMWNGTVRFGMASVPVKLYSATEDHDLELHQVHVKDGARIRYIRQCELCGPDVPIAYENVGKGYETEDGKVVVLTDEMLEEITAHNTSQMEVVEFVPADQIDPLLINKSYFVGPDKAGQVPYGVLRAALALSHKVAIVKVILRSRESLAVLRVSRGTLVMQTLVWPDEVRSPSEVTGLDKVIAPAQNDQTLTLALMVVDSLSADFNPDKYTDEHLALLRGLVAKLEASGQAKPAPKLPNGAENGTALLKQLEASVAAAPKSGD